VSVYSTEGERIDQFPIDISPNVELVDMTELPSDLQARFELMQSMEFTLMRGIHPTEGFVLIDHLSSEQQDGSRRYFIDIFDTAGNLLYHSIDAPYRLEQAIDGRLFFVEEDADQEYGRFIIHEYVLTL